MKNCVFFGIFLLLILLIGCEPPPRTQLADTGIFDEHNLIRIDRISGINMHAHGSFFLGCGSVEVEGQSNMTLMFYWEPKKGEIIASSLPYNKFKFIIDETKDTPTIKFIFKNWVDMPRDGVYKPNEKENVNDFIRPDDLIVAVVKISRKILEKEIFISE